MQQLGDYQLVHSEGKEILGELFLAEHRFLKKPYALKVISEDISSDSQFMSRLQEEVTRLSGLDHPHIIKLHTVSESEGRFFLVTDYIRGDKGEVVNLEQFLKRLPSLEEAQVLKILAQIASALDFAHGKDPHFSHTGLNLNNILIHGKTLALHLADFGLSHLTQEEKFVAKIGKRAVEALDQERNGSEELSFLQNFAFLAPEQKFRPAEVEGVKVDRYAFGVLAYYLLTRQFPEGLFEMPSKINPSYKHHWDVVIEGCLSINPSQRNCALTTLLEKATKGDKPLPQKQTSPEMLRPVLKPTEILRPSFDADPGAIFQTENVVGKYLPEVQEHKAAEPLLTEMVVIRGGPFYRGSSQGGRDEMPRHAVILSSFAIDIHPVTNEQFARFLEAMGGEKDHQNNDIIRLRESRIKRSSGQINVESGYAHHPVVGVTWYGAVAYAKWVGKRLPTEAEWEIAAAGGLEESVYPTGKTIDKSVANFFSSDTAAVMSYPSNGYGLYDMAGNVYEWCQDWYDYHYYDISIQEPNNPKGPIQGVYRVLRGGCWKSLKEDLRCSHRHRNNPGAMNATYGFRCVADVN